ncbi:hypothetical protein BDV93DRAFT_529170 [Ceratobasidium sp. AG-I]|nr:hypothetical protein BDV93DRAFT_529170 [Ceratobasidium sp. AG-I]
MARGSPFSSISLQRRRAPPAALKLARSAYAPLKPVEGEISPMEIVHITTGSTECLIQFEEAEPRTSTELELDQAAFTASLEQDPLPSVRARSPTAYRAARRAIPMEVDYDAGEVEKKRMSFDGPHEIRLPLPEGGYKFPLCDDSEYRFPPVSVPAPRESIGPIQKRGRISICMPLPWSTLVRALRVRGGKRRSNRHVLPEPVGFQERIKHAEHEWRPAYSLTPPHFQEDKGTAYLPNSIPRACAEWPWR